MNRLLVNADDFGLHADINRAIADGVEAGRIRSLSVSTNGSAVDWQLLGTLRDRGARVGVHLTWVDEPWLVDGRLLSRWALLIMTLSRRPMLMAGLREEGRRQIEALMEHGFIPTHMDSHQHVHVLPALWPLTLALARDSGAPRVRVPWSTRWSGARRSPGGVALQMLSSLRLKHATGALPCIGLAASGHNSTAGLVRELWAARGQDLELVLHPGYATPSLQQKYGHWRYDWDAERRSIMDSAWPAAVTAAGYCLE